MLTFSKRNILYYHKNIAYSLASKLDYYDLSKLYIML